MSRSGFFLPKRRGLFREIISSVTSNLIHSKSAFDVDLFTGGGVSSDSTNHGLYLFPGEWTIFKG